MARKENPPWSDNFTAVVETFFILGIAWGSRTIPLPDMYDELKDTMGWSKGYSRKVLERMERFGYVRFEGDEDVKLLPAGEQKGRSANPLTTPTAAELTKRLKF